jgi:hypothetical protein
MRTPLPCTLPKGICYTRTIPAQGPAPTPAPRPAEPPKDCGTGRAPQAPIPGRGKRSLLASAERPSPPLPSVGRTGAPRARPRVERSGRPLWVPSAPGRAHCAGVGGTGGPIWANGGVAGPHRYLPPLRSPPPRPPLPSRSLPRRSPPRPALPAPWPHAPAAAGPRLHPSSAAAAEQQAQPPAQGGGRGAGARGRGEGGARQRRAACSQSEIWGGT